MTICPNCQTPCCNCSCPGCNCKIEIGPDGRTCCTMCLTGLQRIYSNAQQQPTVNVINTQGAVSPDYMKQILDQRLQADQQNRFNQ